MYQDVDLKTTESLTSDNLGDIFEFRKPLYNCTERMCHSSTRPPNDQVRHCDQFYQAFPHIYLVLQATNAGVSIGLLIWAYSEWLECIWWTQSGFVVLRMGCSKWSSMYSEWVPGMQCTSSVFGMIQVYLIAVYSEWVELWMVSIARVSQVYSEWRWLSSEWSWV